MISDRKQLIQDELIQKCNVVYNNTQ